MPLRKTKSRRKPKAPATRQQIKEMNKETKTVPEMNPDPAECRAESEEEVRPQPADDGCMDEEERRARETIASLAKKYQVRLHEDSSNSLDIIRVGEGEVTQCESDQAAQEEKENREQPSSPLSSRRARLLPHRQATLHLQKQPKEVSKKRGATPVFKVPKPLVHHHSTPAPTGDGNLFGFEELDSPLTLSPVSTTPAHSRLSLTQHSHEDCSRLAKPSPYSRLKGTYDIPLKHKTPKRQPGQRRVKRKSDEDQWADKLNAQFTEIEEFELAVE